MKKTGMFMLTLLLSTFVWAQNTSWNFDKSHSSVEFSIDHMVISEVSGKFTDFSGSVITPSENFDGAKIEFVIEAKSIDTDDEDRDNHLRDVDFFNVAKYPQITFVSTSFKKVTEKEYLLLGNLTMHGVTKSVMFDVSYGGTIVDPWGNTKAGFKLIGDLNRKDYGLTWSKTLETGGLIVGEEVELTVRIELVKSN